MGTETRKVNNSSKNGAQSISIHKCESKTKCPSNERKRKFDSIGDKNIQIFQTDKVCISRHPTYTSSVFNSVFFQYERALGNFEHSKLSKFKNSIIINNLKKFKVREKLSPFDRRVTSIAWHPKYPEISSVGSKGGDLLLHSLKKGTDDYLIPGIGPGGSILGLKFCNTDPGTVYSASMVGKVSKENFHKQSSKALLNISLESWDNWFTCLGICYDKNLLMSGDCNGNSYLVKTSGEKVWGKKKLHTAKISHCEFNLNNSNTFITSSIDRTVKLWDLRMLSGSTLKSEPLLKLSFDKGVTSACFSPSNSQSLLVTDHHSQLRVYSSPCWNESFTITHPHRHFQHMTSIKAVWHPIEDIIIVGRYPDDKVQDDKVQLSDQRTIDFYDGSTGDILHQIRSPSGNIVSLNAVNSTGDTLLLAAGHQVIYMQDESVFSIHNYSLESDSESQNTEIKSPNKKSRTSTKVKTANSKKSFKGTKTSSKTL